MEQNEPSAAAWLFIPTARERQAALTLYLRIRGDAAAVAEFVRSLVNRIDARVPIAEMGTLAAFNEKSFAVQLWLARAAVAMGLAGLMLATAGLYGASSYLVAVRCRELAIAPLLVQHHTPLPSLRPISFYDIRAALGV